MMMNSPPLRSPCCLLVALVAGLVVVVVVVSVFDATFVDETPKNIFRTYNPLLFRSEMF